MRLKLFKEALLAALHDVATAQRRREQLEYYAYHDALTGLPNLYLLRDRLEQALLQAQRRAHGFAVMFVDVDRFKLVNDCFGHHAGDELLKQISARLTRALRAGDTAARFGGDEFVVVLPETNESDSIHMTIDRIGAALHRPVTVEGREIAMSCSVGVSLFPRDGADCTTLLRNADRAMYREKARNHADSQPGARSPTLAGQVAP